MNQYHKVNLLTYKKNNKVPKGLLLKLNLALCTDNNVLGEHCNNILFSASSQIRNKIIKSFCQKINYLKKERKNLLNNIKASTNHEEIETIKRNIYSIKNSIKRKTVPKQNCKHRSDMNVIYLISCTYCNEQYVIIISAIDFKKHIKIHKRNINTKNDTYGDARHFTNKCRNPQNPHTFLKIKPIEQVSVKAKSKLDDTLWHREKYWQTLLSTNYHGITSTADLYSKKGKGYTKK